VNKKHNAVRLSTIILDIGTKVIRAHIQHFLDLNNYNNVKELIYNNNIVSKEMLKLLKKECFGKIPASLDSFDITKSFALIKNVINKLHNTSKCRYDSKNYDYCKRLKDIRNEKYAHMFFFEMNDIDFSVTVVTIEEIIRQVCDYDSSLCKDYLDKIEVELDKDNSEINNLKSDVITLLLGQKQELQMMITSLSNSSDSKIRSFGGKLKKLTGVVQSQNDKFLQLINEMKKHEGSRRLIFKVFLEQTVILKEIKLDTTETKSDIAEIKSTLDTMKNRLDEKPGVSKIDLASSLPPCPLASNLYNRKNCIIASNLYNEAEIFAELPKHKLSCIAGMAGVGKSTLAITYGHHRKQVHQAKVSYLSF